MLGHYYTLKYMLCKQDELKQCTFHGVCINKRRKYFKLVNKIKREIIVLRLQSDHPTIISMRHLKKKHEKIKKIF